MGKPTEPHLSNLKIIDNKFVMVPSAWIPLMHEHGRGIPAAFWLCLLAVWADVVGKGRYKLEATKTMQQFPLRPAAARKWAAALSVSGLFYVRYGFRHTKNEPGTPTVFRYKDASRDEWIAFIVALAEQCKSDKAGHFTAEGSIDGYRADLALRVDAERTVLGLPRDPGIQAYLNWCQKNDIVFEKDGETRIRRQLSDRLTLDFGKQEATELKARQQEEDRMWRGAAGLD